ncbi:alpha,alpha-trehalose-phosphate synthase [Streptomyces eurocidicus]|uniref:Alpha,alpha-trehalose-phosphate synthase n=1 Tax=Streptomyces eurocidicus TaxID=66423 RepID=A0A2N8NWR4_STREU|nr:trehalose-6-phosphate synthase [Streptomyces eurocidicus]MBB5118037.1 trehalose 6-phosphate synthase [Streptomyces eurocidicus]MBF6054011.1 trehalose-6-phosphate synthase [Streptomyces eurocidicus]PNE33182.1 alpha,alpha-trehalose-phosphate synthase [Streptomyces eurocidicus]
MVAAPTPPAPIVVASNRGPVSYRRQDDGTLVAGRGGGGLVSGLGAIGTDAGAVWVCAALGEGDREAARAAGRRLGAADTGGHRVRMLDIPPDTFAAAYNGIANSVLWFVHHLLYQTPLEPTFDAEFRRQWAAYEAYNRAFADALAEEAAHGAAVLVQDYHLTLVPGLLRERRPDLRIGHFSHTPWAPPDYFRMLPDDVAGQVLRGILGGDRAAFLTHRWAEAFAECCASELGAEVVREDGRAAAVRFEGRTTLLGVHGLGADADFLRRRAHEPDVEERMAALRAQIGPGRRAIVRVDRTELSKNIVRGLLAYRRLLEERPQWRGKVVHVAFAYPSRQDLAVYRDYTATVERVAREINSAFGTEGWEPVVLHVKDDFARSLAAYRLADVALVNPVRDGMNLVAKEVPVVSDHGCALVLSREAGAAAELAEDALTVNPFDVEATARALHEALLMDPAERAERTKRLAAAATALPPARWFLDQLRALGG